MQALLLTLSMPAQLQNSSAKLVVNQGSLANPFL